MIRKNFLNKETSMTILACVASVVLLASCSSSGDSGGGNVIPNETTATGTITGGTGTGTITGGTGTGTVTGGTGTGSGTGTGGIGTGTITGGTGTSTGTGGTGTVTGGSDTGGTFDGSSLIGFYQMDSLDLINDADPALAAPPGFGYLDIGQLADGQLSFILMFADFDLNCSEVVVATPITSTGGNNFIDLAGDEFSITLNGRGVTVLIEPLSMSFSPANGITFTDLQLCDL